MGVLLAGAIAQIINSPLDLSRQKRGRANIHMAGAEDSFHAFYEAAMAFEGLGD